MTKALLIKITFFLSFILVGVFILRQERPLDVTKNIIPQVDEISIEEGKVDLLGDKSDLQETGKMSQSASKFWWLNSGGIVTIEENKAKTVQGELSDTKWQPLYAKNNPTDTDNGTHPQNIFRMVTRSKWQDSNQSVYFKINKLNLSSSSNRNESNGVLLFHHYLDGDNLYYAGVRVDGYAVIKKKIKGKYYTLAYEPFFEGAYNRDTNPNLLPLDTWIGLKTEISNLNENQVSIKLFVDNEKTGEWVLAAEAVDDGTQFGGDAISKEGFAGIRTDFMDVEFENYKVEEI